MFVMQKTPGKPIYTAKSGPASIPIYKSSNRGRPLYAVRWQSPTGRKQKNYADLDKAKVFAKTVAADVAAGKVMTGTVTASDGEALRYAKQKLRPHGLNIAVAAEEITQALDRLQGQATLAECVDYYLRHGATIQKKISVADAVQEYLEEKSLAVERNELSRAYLRGIVTRLKRFGKAFEKMDLESVNREAIRTWLDRADLSARNYNNFLGVFVAFFNWARSKGYLPEGVEVQPAMIPRRGKARGTGKKPVWTVEEFSSLLEASEDREELRLFFLLAAATGARTEELIRQKWGNFNWDEGTLDFPSEITKTDRERTAPIQGSLINEIKKYAEPSGEVFPTIANGDALGDKLTKWRKKNGLGWKVNAFRHTAISAKVRAGQDMAKVAEEHGTSVAMIKTNYQKLMTEKQANDWLSFSPSGKKSQKKIVPLKSTRRRTA